MQRVRRAATAVLALVVVLCLSSGPATGLPIGLGTARAASVAWPTSTLVLSEVQTGGSSASDEFVEIANQGEGPVDLIGLEIVYATSSGSTVTRKATWSGSTILGIGKRLLLVNGAGSYVGMGDAAYTGGFAATGGALALRIVGGSVIDSVGWGDATNAFVEGTAAPAPPVGSSLERRPGGPAGNGTDTNDNGTDWFVNAVPGAQNLAAPAVPNPGSSPGPTATPAPTPTPPASPTPSPSPTPVTTPPPTTSPTPDPTSSPTPDPTPPPTAEPTPTPSPTPSPSPSPTPAPTPTPTPAPTPTPTPTPTATPTPAPISILAARALPDGATATVSGVLTTDLGALESGRTAFLQDETGGIALYLDAAVVTPIAAGARIAATGTVDERYAQRTLRVREGDLAQLGATGLPVAVSSTTGSATESFEGTVVSVTGTIVGAPDRLADGTAVSVDDGSGPLRVIVTPSALGDRSLGSGVVLTADGPLGQRDSSGTGSSGYRLYVTRPGDLTILQTPKPTPSLTPDPTPTPSPTPTPGPTESPASSSTPAPSPTPPLSSPTPPAPTPTTSATPPPTETTIADVRTFPIGSRVFARGVVTAEAGRLGTPALFAIGDATGGVVVKLPEGVAAPARGRIVEVRGTLMDPYGQLEIRPGLGTDLVVGGTNELPQAVDLPPTGPDETTEGRLTRIAGLVVVRAAKATSGDISLTIETSDGTRVRIMADASSGVPTSAFDLYARYRTTGIAGQRASKKGAPDGYRIWIRDAEDVVLLAAPPPGSSPSPSPSPSPKPKSPTPSTGSAATVSVATALRTTDRDVAIDAVVTATAGLLDSSGRRIVVQDGTAAVEVLLPKDVHAPSVGIRIRAIGRIGTAYGAPRLRAESVETKGSASAPAPLRITGPLTNAHTWRLVSIGGRVESVRKLGDRWRAEVVVGSATLVAIGQPGSGIPTTALVEGRTADIVGIVRPAYPSATDRRSAVLPRSIGDIRLGAPTSAGSDPSSPANGGAGDGSVGSTGGGIGLSGSASPTAHDADLVDLESLVGQMVRVGGLVVDLRPNGFTLDDGTAVGLVVLEGPASESLPLIEPEDAINVVGRVDRLEGGELAVVVDDPAAISLGSALDGLAGSSPAPGPASAAVDAPSDLRVAGFAAGATLLPGAGAGLAGLLGISVVSATVALVRRRQIRRLMAARIAARLATFGGQTTASRDPTTP
jgi:outer membrane biosynthesis protein TonB